MAPRDDGRHAAELKATPFSSFGDARFAIAGLGFSEETPTEPLLGMGYSTLSGELKNFPVGRDDVEPLNSIGTQFYVDVATTEEELIESLRLHASASFRAFGAKVTASADYVRKHKFSRYTVCIIAHEVVDLGGEALAAYRLRPEAARKVNAYGKAAFYTSYGDSFVSQIRYGARLSLVYYFDCQTQTEYEKITIAIRAKYSGWKFAADVEASLTQSQIRTLARLSILAPGYEGTDIPAAADSAAVARFVQDFPKLVGAQERKGVVQFSSQPVNVCDNWPPSALMEVETQRRTIAAWAKTRQAGSQVERDLDKVLESPQLYFNPDISSVRSGKHALGEQLLQIDYAARDLMLAPWRTVNTKPDTNFDQFRNLIPIELPTDRPLIIGKWEDERGRSGEDATNRSDLIAHERWISQRPGSYAALRRLSLRFAPPQPGLNLAFSVEDRNGKKHPWWDTHNADSPAPENPVIPAGFRRISFRLTGDSSHLFQFKCQVHLAWIGDSDPFEADGAYYPPQLVERLEALRISLLPTAAVLDPD